MALPLERVITVYPGEKSDNKGRFLEALCDRDESVMKKADEMAEAFEERLKNAKERKRVK